MKNQNLQVRQLRDAIESFHHIQHQLSLEKRNSMLKMIGSPDVPEQLWVGAFLTIKKNCAEVDIKPPKSRTAGGKSPAVFARIQHHLSTFMESHRMIQTGAQTEHPKQENFLRILKIAQKTEDWIERVNAFSHLLLESSRDGLPSAFISSISCFLCGHSELIPRFFSDTTILRLLHMFVSTPDRLKMVLIILPSLTPQLVDVLLSNKDLHDLLSLSSRFVPESDMVNVFIQVVAIAPAPLRHITLGDLSRLTSLAEYALKSVQDISEDQATPQCLNFGRHTNTWTRFAESVNGAEWNEQERSAGITNNAWITLLVVLAASEDAALSTAAQTLFQRTCGLSAKQTQTLLFSPPPPFPLHSDWPLSISDEFSRSGSVCAAVGHALLQHHTPQSDREGVCEFLRMVTIFIMSWLVPVLHATHPSTSSRFQFFTAELRNQTDQSLWSFTNDTSTSQLVTLSEQISLSAGELTTDRHVHNKVPQLVYHRLILNDVHTLPFVSDEVKCTLITRIGQTLKITRWLPAASCWSILNFVMDIALINSTHSSQAVVAKTSEIVKYTNWEYERQIVVEALQRKNERMIRERMAMAEGEEKWDWFLRLWVMGRLSIEEQHHFFLLAETDAQMNFALPNVDMFDRSRQENPVWAEEESASRLIEAAGKSPESELSMKAWAIVGKVLLPLTSSTAEPTDETMVERNKNVTDLILRVLTDIVQKSDNRGEGKFLSLSSNAWFVTETSVELFSSYLFKTTFDVTPFIPVLASLCRTRSIYLLNFLIPIYERFERLTTHTSSPFSFRSYSILYSPNEHGPPELLTLLHIISSIFLSFLLSKEDTEDAMRSFNKGMIHTMMEMGMKMAELAVEMLDSVHSLSSPTQLPKHFIQFGESNGRVRWTPQRIWAALLPFWKNDEQIALIRTNFLQFVPHLARLACATLRFTDDRQPADCYDRQKWKHAFCVFETILVLLRSLDQTVLDTNPTLSTLLSSLTILFVRRDFSLPPLVSIFTALFPNFRHAHDSRMTRFPVRPKLEGFLYPFREEGLDDRIEADFLHYEKRGVFNHFVAQTERSIGRDPESDSDI
ncbi:hypothetical protein BLNAU_9650 [Blattamonas nauphoetae]|uniref:Uncharacterized protein n=1 Tax=Blattamonas nauphoetae TaxID=2049346 RepID=A0ABQ9XVD1_9EUKA|nr:hypothetical protein BLNAU_9650 [Blattamonas nauphoetae]